MYASTTAGLLRITRSHSENGLFRSGRCCVPRLFPDASLRFFTIAFRVINMEFFKNSEALSHDKPWIIASPDELQAQAHPVADAHSTTSTSTPREGMYPRTTSTLTTTAHHMLTTHNQTATAQPVEKPDVDQTGAHLNNLATQTAALVIKSITSSDPVVNSMTKIEGDGEEVGTTAYDLNMIMVSSTQCHRQPINSDF